MILSLNAVIHMAAVDLPTPFTPAHVDDIACVALFGVIAAEQSNGIGGMNDIPDLRQTGRKWAGLVGDRVMFETGQPQEVVAFAINAAVQAEQAHPGGREKRVAKCMPRMQADLAADDVAAGVMDDAEGQ